MFLRKLSLAVFCLIASCLPALAKPPELPADVRDECREYDQPQPNGIILTSSKKKANPLAEEVPAPKDAQADDSAAGLCTVDFLCPCMGEWLRHFYQSLIGDCNPPVEEQEQKPTSDSDVSCPYLKDRQGNGGPTQGMTLPAGRYLQHPPQYIPTSPDFPLTKELAALEGVAAEQAAAKNKSTKQATCGRDGDVCHNLAVLQRAKKIYRKAETCRRQGESAKAERYYEKVQRVSPGSRYDRLASKRLKQLKTPSTTESGEESEPTPQPQSPHGPEAVLVPELPAVDPKLVDALEQLLRCTGDPACPKLIIQVDDVDPAQEHADDPVSQWPLQPFDAEVPGSLLEPAQEPAETEAPEEEPPAVQMPPAADVDFVLREVLESLAARTCIEVDPSRLGTDMPVGQIQLGPVLFRLVADDLAGWRCFLVTLKTKPVNDPRAAQWQQNERILQWIESLSGNSQSKEPDSWDDEPLIEEDILDESSDS